MQTCPTCGREVASRHRFCPYDGAAVLVLPDVAVASDPLLGAVLLEQFELRECIGEGVSGTVYRAWQAPMQRWVAVKILRDSLRENSAMVARMGREARAIARVSHPGVVEVFVCGETPAGLPALVMEFVNGATLADELVAIGSGAAMAEERAVAIARQVASALAASHRAGVVHRDLKPGNIMLVNPGRASTHGDQVKVLDFGIAKFVGGQLVNGDGELTVDGAICGTPETISPEQANGEAVDARADLYSLGVVLYRMLAGRAPFEGNPVSVILGHALEEPPPLAHHIREPLRRIVMSCLEKDPDARPSTAEEIIRSLDALAASEVSEVSDAEASAARPRRQRKRGGVRAVALVAAALGILGVGGVVGATQWRSRVGHAGTADGRAPTGPLPRHEHGATPRTSTDGRDRSESAAAASREVMPDVVSTPAQVPVRDVIISEGGYALRVHMPARMLTGVEYAFDLELWDPEGFAVDTSELVVTFEGQAGTSRGAAARSVERIGKFSVATTFTARGLQQMRVYLPAGGPSLRLFFEVLAARGKVEPGPIRSFVAG